MVNILSKGNFTIDIYESTIHVYICKDQDTLFRVANRIIKRYKEPESILDRSVKGACFSPDIAPCTYFIWFCPEFLDVNTITHETDHIRNYILDFCSIAENNDSKEASANLNGYINEKVFKFITDSGFEINFK